MRLRRFLNPGVEAFREYLAEARVNPKAEPPLRLLEDGAFSALVLPAIDVEPQELVTRADAARYLTKLLAPLPEQDVEKDAGLWTWLTLFFFDQVCPLRGGRRNVRNDYTYIFEPNNTRHYYRHLLFIAWQVSRIARGRDRLFLRRPVSSLDKVTSEVMKRLFLTRIPCIFELLDRIYWDEKLGRSRPGITGNSVKPGDLTHRLPVRIQQLEKTYDLLSLNAGQLIELLGDEFRQYDTQLTSPQKRLFEKK